MADSPMACRVLESVDLSQSSQGRRPSFRRRIADPRLQALYDLWLARREARVAMLRADLDPTEMPSLLQNLILAEVDDDGASIRYRLVGTEIVDAHGFDYTGRTVEQLTSGATLDFTRALYGIVVSRAVPVYSEGRFRWAGREYRWTKRLHLPMSRTGDTVDMVLCGCSSCRAAAPRSCSSRRSRTSWRRTVRRTGPRPEGYGGDGEGSRPARLLPRMPAEEARRSTAARAASRDVRKLSQASESTPLGAVADHGSAEIAVPLGRRGKPARGIVPARLDLASCQFCRHC